VIENDDRLLRSISLPEVVDEQHADIVVAGMKKEGILIRQFFGSTVTVLAKQLPMPLLVVPDEVMFNIEAPSLTFVYLFNCTMCCASAIFMLAIPFINASGLNEMLFIPCCTRNCANSG
jgi:hypothetical protein